MKTCKTNELDELMKEALVVEAVPSTELNDQLKSKLYEKETELMRMKSKQIRLWYIPMVMNALLFLILNMMARVFMSNAIFIQVFNIICVYQIAMGVVLTLVGLKFCSLKETFIWNKHIGGNISWKTKVKNIS